MISKTHQTNKIILSIAFFVLCISVLLYAFCTHIDYYPWISYWSPEVGVESKPVTKIYYFYSPLMINATSYRLLSKTMSFIDKVHWNISLTTGNITIASFFGHDGIDYGGIIVRSGLSITLHQRKDSNQSYESYFTAYVLDIRDICAGTAKVGTCNYEYPFKQTSKSYFFLQRLGLFIINTIIIIALSLLISLQRSQKADKFRDTLER